MTNFSLSSLAYPNCQLPTYSVESLWKLVNTPTMFEKYSSFNMGPMNPQNLSNHKRNIWKLCLLGLPPSQGYTKSFGFTCKWQNKPNSFFNNMCTMVAFNVTAPKMESSTDVATIMPLEVGFKKWKATTNNGNRVLLTYSTIICIKFAHPTNALTTSRDLKHGSNINVNMLWALLTL